MAQIALSNVDVKPASTWRKFFAYLFNQAAGGQQTASVLGIWYAWVAKESGKNIHGNNPLNITCGKGDGCYKGQIGWFQFPGNNLKFVAFDTPEHGAQAAVGLINSDVQNRDGGGRKVIASARAGDGAGMLDGIAHMCWLGCGDKNTAYATSIRVLAMGGRYGTGFITTAAQDLKDNAFANIPNAASVITGDVGDTVLGAWANVVAFPVGHKLTEDDVNHIIQQLDAVHFFSTNAPPIFQQLAENTARDTARAILMRHVGESWDKSLQDKLNTEFGIAANAATDNPLQTIADVAAALVNPQTYVRTLALLLGLTIALVGFKMLMDASVGGSTENTSPYAAGIKVS